MPLDDHEERLPIWSDDVADTAKAHLFITPNGSPVGGIGIGLHLCDFWIVEELAYESGDHASADSLLEFAFIAEKLISAVNARIGFVLPPSISTLNCDIGLNEAYRFVGEQSDVRLDRRVLV